MIKAAIIAMASILAVEAAYCQTEASHAKPASLRTPDGHPSLEGIWTSASVVPMERPANLKGKEFYTEQEAAENAMQVLGMSSWERLGSQAPEHYNMSQYGLDLSQVKVASTLRTSLIVGPDGRVPPLTPEAQKRRGGDAYSRRTSDEGAREEDPGFEGSEAYNDPEIRPLAERCLVGFSSTSGPPILPTYFYNNLHQIVQTKDSVMILTEMVHDARVVRINGQHPPSTVRKWLGDSIGHWDGDTLVVETTNFTDKTRFRGSTENMKVIERFTRIDARTLRYQFTVEDPATWTRPWTAEYAWPATKDLLYEYACQEGNYALGNILRGARLKEKEEAAKKQ